MPLVVALVLAGTGLISLYLWSASTSNAVKRSDLSQAQLAYSNQMRITAHFPTPWLSQYNLGTVRVASGSIDEGVELLEQAFYGVPKAVVQEDGSIGVFSYECSVRLNLSAGIEKRADLLKTSGDPDGALEDYRVALEWVEPCQMSGSGGSGSDSDDESGGGQGGEQGDQGDQGGQGDEGGSDGGQGEGSQGSSDPEASQQTGETADRLNEKIKELEGSEEGDSPSESGTGGDPGSNNSSSGGQGQQDQNDSQESEAEKERREQLEQKNRDQAERQREKQESQNRNPGTGGW